jgi:predicted aspartyl protease
MTTAALPRPARSTATPIYLDRDGRSVRVDVTLGSLTHRMVIDTGMTGLSIPMLVAERLLLRRDAIESDDAILTLANGAKEWRRGIEIRSVRVGGRAVLNVYATVAPYPSEPLLGFPILNQLGRFTIDTIDRLLIMG